MRLQVSLGKDDLCYTLLVFRLFLGLDHVKLGAYWHLLIAHVVEHADG